MSDRENTLDQITHLADEMTEVAMAGQVAGLRLLAAEMEALARMMPGANLTGDKGLAPSHTDAEIEADFDNMPV